MREPLPRGSRTSSVSPAEAFAACETSVRRNDPDRYFASLFAPARSRPFLFALYAFNHEIARAAQNAREPMMGEIRLQWWREAIGDATGGAPRVHPVVIALTEVLLHTGCRRDALDALIDARSLELSATPFADMATLESHAAATAGALMRIAASLLDSGADTGDLAREAGTAYGLSGILRALPFYAAHGRSFLPEEIAVADVAQTARSHFDRARAMNASRRVLPAILPASLVPASLALVLRTRRDPLSDTRDLSLFRRQLILFGSAMLGRL